MPPSRRTTLRQTLAAFLSGSINRRIFSASLLVAVLGAIVKCAALSKEIVVAWRFGISDDLDAFNVALLVPFAVINILALSFQTAFIPAYLQVRIQTGTSSAQRLLLSATIWLAAMLTLFAVIIVAGGKMYLFWLAPGFAPAKLQFTFTLLCLLGAFPILAGISGLWGAVLNAHKRFTLVALSPGISILLTLIFLFALPRQDAFVLVAALLAGAALEVLLLGLALQWSGIFRFNERWQLMPLNAIIRQSGTLILSNLFASATGMIGVAMAARYAGGSVASLAYANKLIALLTGLAAAALSTVLMPYFVQMIAQQNWQQLRRTRNRFLQLTFGVTIPLTILVVLLAQPLTKLVFYRGAFSVAAVDTVALLFACLAIQIPFYMGGAIVSRLLESLQASGSLLLVTLAGFVICLFATWGLQQKFQLAGIALAVSLTYVSSFLLLYFLAERKLQKAECASH